MPQLAHIRIQLIRKHKRPGRAWKRLARLLELLRMPVRYAALNASHGTEDKLATKGWHLGTIVLEHFR